MINFKEMKERVRIVDVLVHYGVRLRCKFGSEYASAACPLPTHPEHDKGNNSFGVHILTNRWQCKNTKCGAKNGVADKWGDCINLVMVLDGITARDAAIKIDTWFPREKTAPLSEARAVQGAVAAPLPHIPDNTSRSDSVKPGYMQSVGVWFDAFVIRRINESDAEYLKRLKKGVMERIYESFKNGQRKAQGLAPEQVA
jgi:hypothetical protein